MPRKLSNWLNAFVAYTSYNEAPQQYNFWSGVAAIAGALRRKVYIDQYYFRWTPNFYIILTGPSGMGKSVSIDSAMDLLHEVQGVYFGPDTMSWQALIDDLHKAEEMVEGNDGEYETQSCLTFSSMEWGSLVNFRDSQFISVLTDLWDGKTGSWRKATVTKAHSIVTNPWINMIAGTTPSWIADNVPSAVIGGGFTSRCVFVWGDKKKNIVSYPRRLVESQRGDTWIKGIKAELIHDLEAIALITGEYTLDKEAEEFGDAWYHRIQTSPPSHLLIGQFDGYLARKQGHVHKVAMVIAASYKDERVISSDDLQRAVLVVESLEADMARVFSNIRSDPGGVRVEEVLRVMQIHRKLTRPALFRLAFATLHMQEKEFNEIVNSAIAAGYVLAGAELMLEINPALDTRAQPFDTTGQTSSPEATPFPEADDS